MNRVNTHPLVTRALGLAPVARAGWVADEVNATWWFIGADGRCSPLPTPQHPHFRSSVASDPAAGRQ